MKLISFAILILIALTVNAQQDKVQHIKEIKFEGFHSPKENVEDAERIFLSTFYFLLLSYYFYPLSL